jgi:hypothetical protein
MAGGVVVGVGVVGWRVASQGVNGARAGLADGWVAGVLGVLWWELTIAADCCRSV